MSGIFAAFDLRSLFLKLLDLVRDHYWIAVLLVQAGLTVISIYLIVLTGGAIQHLRRLTRRFNRWYVLFPSLACAAALTLLSVALVNFLRTLPTPELALARPSFLHSNIVQWSPPRAARSEDLIFEVQRSTSPDFFEGTESTYTKDNMIPASGTDNTVFHLRVRSIELDPQTRAPERYGPWSPVLKVEHYGDALERIRRRRILTVAMENEFNDTDVRWIQPVSQRDQSAKFIDVPRIATRWLGIAFPSDWDWGTVPIIRSIEYHGLEVEIAYEIADALCRQLFEAGDGAAMGGRKHVCAPSRAVSGAVNDERSSCADRDCVAIAVRFVGLPWAEVMKSVGTGQYDVAISTITYKPERESQYGIIFGRETYKMTDFGIVSKATQPISASMLKGRRLAVQEGTTSFDCMKLLGEAYQREGDKVGFQIIPQFKDKITLNLLLEGRGGFDAAVKDGTIADGWKAAVGDRIHVDHTQPELFGDQMPAFCRKQEYRIAFNASDLELRSLADRVIARLRDSGELASIQRRSADDYRTFVRSTIVVEGR